jgi:serine/threonine-protein kinase HipA
VSACLACLRPLAPPERYHPGCLKALLGRTGLPRIELELRRLHTVGLEIAGRVALSGVQRKVAMRLSEDGHELVPAPEGNWLILKPASATFPAVPENEHATLRLAQLCGIPIPPCALVELKDHTWALLLRRFDRVGGKKLRMEDFCQLAQRPSKDRYTGSAELCVRLVRQFASEPVIELVKLFRLLTFSWWVGNGDLHLKNLSLLCGEDGLHRLSPAYDLVNTQVAVGDHELALPVKGKKRNLTVRHWLELGDYCGLPRSVVVRELGQLGAKLEPALELLGRSRLPAELREAYAQGLRERSAVLGMGGS